MLHQFVTSNLPELITRCRNKMAERTAPAEPPASMGHGVPLFLQQVVDTLRLEHTAPGAPVAPEDMQATTEISRVAGIHGADLLRCGYSVDEVVHEYGDVCQAITELAGERDQDISASEFRIFNRCLDNAIADALTSYTDARDVLINDHAVTMEHRLSMFSEDHRRLLDIALLSHAAIQRGTVGQTGATGTLFLHVLEELGSLTDKTMPALRLAAAAPISPVPSLSVLV